MASAPESDEEVTPRPLRIKIPHNTNPSLPKIPQRSSSFYFSHSSTLTTQSLADFYSNPSCLIPSPEHSPSLIVNKSRRSDTNSSTSYDTSSSARRRIRSISNPHPSHAASSPNEQVLGRATSSLEHVGEDISAYAEELSTATSHDPVSDAQSSMLSATSTTATSFPHSRSSTQVRIPIRANDIDDGLNSYDPGHELSIGCKTPRFSAYKQRFLHKVGFGFRAISSCNEGIADLNKPDTEDLEEHQSLSERKVSLDSSSSNGAKWTTTFADVAILDFPSPLSTPTRSSFTSRTTATSMSSAPWMADFAATQRSTCPVLAVKLSLTPEVDHVAMNCESNMFVAVDIEAVVPQARQTNLEIAEGALDVAVIIDNCALSSPASLMTSCEATCHVCTQLRCPKDRLAVLTTHGCDRELGPRIVVPMGPILTRRIREMVDTIAIFPSQPESKVAAAVDAAVKLVMNMVSKDIEANDSHRSLRHVIIFTTDFDAASLNTSCLDESISFHFVNPSLVPWKSSLAPSNRGWIISNGLSSTQSTQLSDQDLHSRLRDMLVDLRHRRDHGRLSNVAVRVEAGYKCALQGIMGETFFPELFPGETRTILVKVHTDPLPDQWSRLDQFLSDSQRVSGAIDLDKELENIIENDHRTILHVTVQYEHSLLPQGTLCTFQAGAHVFEHVQLTGEWSGFLSLEATLAATVPTRNSVVQRRIISHLASHQRPRQALITLAADLSSPSNSSTCAGYLEAVLRELKHQARLQERCDGVSDDRLNGHSHDNRTQSNTTQNLSCGYEATPSYAHSPEWTSTIKHRPLSRPMIQPRKYVSVPTSEEGTDMARKIWLELRRNSRNASYAQMLENPPEAGHVKSSAFSADELERIQLTALSNKRSLGQDTMRSLSYAGVRAQASAPWL